MGDQIADRGTPNTVAAGLELHLKFRRSGTDPPYPFEDEFGCGYAALLTSV